MEAFKANKDVLLRVIELADLGSIKVLRQVPVFRTLIIVFERSIVKTRHKIFTLPAGYGGSPAYLVYRKLHGGPQRDSSNHDFASGIVSIHHWRSLKEAQVRDDEIQVLLNAPFLRLLPAPGGAKDFSWPKLDPKAKGNMRDLLQRALYLCDTLRDMEAQAVVELNFKADNWEFNPHTWTWPAGEESKEKGSSFDQVAPGLNIPYQHLQRILEEFSVPLATRRLQNAFLEELPDEDLVAIYALTRIATESWHENNMMPAHRFGNTNSSLWEKELTFRETLLRHGSWFLYGEVRGFSSRACHRKRLLEVVHEQVVAPVQDTLVLRQPSLVSTVNDELHKRYRVRIRDLDSKVLPVLAEIIGAEAEAFNDPPSTHGHGSAAM